MSLRNPVGNLRENAFLWDFLRDFLCEKKHTGNLLDNNVPVGFQWGRSMGHIYIKTVLLQKLLDINVLWDYQWDRLIGQSMWKQCPVETEWEFHGNWQEWWKCLPLTMCHKVHIMLGHLTQKVNMVKHRAWCETAASKWPKVYRLSDRQTDRHAHVQSCLEAANKNWGTKTPDLLFAYFG